MAILRAFLVSFLLTLVACSSLTKPGSPGVGTAGPIAHSIKNTVILLGKKDVIEWRGAICAGEFIGPDRFLTAAHCIASATYTEPELVLSNLGLEDEPDGTGRQVRFVTHDEWLEVGKLSDAEQMRGMVAKIDKKNDVALVVTEFTVRDWVVVRDRQAKLDEPVYAIGHPGGLLYTLSKGYIAYERRHVEGRLYSQADLGVWYGNSGGGLYDSAGYLIGVCSSMMETPNISFFVHIDPMKKLISASASIKFE